MMFAPILLYLGRGETSPLTSPQFRRHLYDRINDRKIINLLPGRKPCSTSESGTTEIRVGSHDVSNRVTGFTTTNGRDRVNARNAKRMNRTHSHSTVNGSQNIL